jgi:hypothetical protein
MTAATLPSVRITSEHIIPSSYSEKDVPLGPLDSLVTPIVPVAVAYIYQAPTTDSHVLDVSRMKRALELLLDHYPHLGGRLRLDAQTGRRKIDRLGSGATFHEAYIPESLSTFITSSQPFSLANFPEGGNELLPPYCPTEQSVQKDAILAVQHTRFSCGSAALGIRILHTVVDAEGYFQVVADLATLYRSLADTVGV